MLEYIAHVRLLSFTTAGALLMLLMLGCAGREPVSVEAPATGSLQDEIAPGSRPPLPAAHWQDTAQRLTAALTERGYVVQTGQVRFFQLEHCLALKNCYGNNPTSPYGMYCLPPAPGDTVPDLHEPPCPPGSNLRWAWRLRPDEAIVFLGKTPPLLRYFSFRSYLLSRPGWFRQRRLFASLGDALNLEVIATAGTPNGEPGDPLAQETVVITTADRRQDALLREILPSSGAPAAIINTDIIPPALANLGLEKRSDGFMMLFRVALFADPAAGERYVQEPPATILRATPAVPSAIDPFPVPPLRPRGTRTSEAWLRSALEELIAAVKARYPDLAVRNRRTITFDLSGRQCIERGTPCLGDNPDAVYNSSIPTWLSDNPQDFLVVVGVHHEGTGKARYMNLAPYHTKRLMGTGAVTGRELSGSAGPYLPDHPLRKYLYAYKFARDCRAEPFCFSVPTGQLGVPLDDALNIIERPYLESETNTGPLPSQLINPQTLHFCPSFTMFGYCDS